MEYENYIPPGYLEAYEKLLFVLQMAPDRETKKKLCDFFSQKYTMLSYLWEHRIKLELPPEPEMISKDVFELCLKLKKKAMKHFYYHAYLFCLPGRLQEPCKPEKMQKLVQIFHLPYVEVLSKICDIKMKEAFRILACKNIEQFLTFPHSQLSRFYRHYQRNSGTPLPAEIQEKYEKAVKSYQKMILVAMKPDEWIEWMKESFSEENWIQNFECKLGEHFFMKEIWLAYIEYLDEHNNVDVLDVYKRYCRLFVNDAEMRLKYSEAIKKYSSKGFNVLQWRLDQLEYEVDFISGEIGLPALKKFLKDDCSNSICRECFEAKNQQFFKGQLSYNKTSTFAFWKKKKEVLECCLCEFGKPKDENVEENETEVEKEMCFRKSLAAIRTRTIKFHPIVKIFFHDSFDPPLPRSIFQYIIKTANHEILSKLYAIAKYFYIKQRILLCFRIQISSSIPTEAFLEKALFTNAKILLKSPVKKYCCGTTLAFQDSSSNQKNLLSKCLPKLCCCSLTHLIIHGQNLSIDEFKVLLSNGKMEQVELKEVRIFKENEKMLKIEEIIEMLPTVIDLTINTKSRQMFTPNSARNIAILDRNEKKFESFRLYHGHMQPRGYLRLKLRENVNDQFRLAYKHFLSTIKNHWTPSYQGPQFGYHE
uniref:Uncharacterized protein n=1 Tax=Panagrolaimus sp. PS1159 TaxID=55785 RepID=A0AC35G2H6_9BILA